MIDWLTWWWTMPALSIDTAQAPDLHAMADLHAAGFRHEWTAEELAELMRQPGVHAYVARRASFLGSRGVAGFVLIRAAADEAEVLTIAVAPAHRGEGIGRRLLEHAFRRLYADRVASVFLEVDAANPSALALYRRLGFVQVGERKGYYADAAAPDGDTPKGTALVMRADLG
jgi:ribosomal-protein-alanine N-acetyltransferase